jgi:hypothetical protein
MNYYLRLDKEGFDFAAPDDVDSDFELIKNHVVVGIRPDSRIKIASP